LSNQQVVDLMERVWRSIDSLCSPLTEAQWKTSTDCPGWSVQDQVSHLVGAESQIRDADIAEEIALLVRNQILVEAAVAVLAQANLEKLLLTVIVLYKLILTGLARLMALVLTK